MAKTFVLNDEDQVNSYGFRVRNEGINLSRFEANPVMLSDHWNHTGNVIGRWENVRIEGSKLLADAVFDEQDPEAMKIASKVEGGFLKGCSMGIRYSYEYMEERPDGSYVLVQSELMEVSIVAVPSNSNSVKLYSPGGELLDDEQITLSLSEFKSKNQYNMSKILLAPTTLAILSAHGLKNAESPSEVDDAVAKLNAALEAEKTAHVMEKTQREQLDQTVKEFQKAQLDAMIDQAVEDGRIVADQKETFTSLGYEAAKKVIDGLPKRKSLAAQVIPGSPSESKEPATKEEFSQMKLEEQLAFKNSNPEGYKKLFA